MKDESRIRTGRSGNSHTAPELLTDRNDEFRALLTRRLPDLEPSGIFTGESAILLIMAKRSGKPR
jgi:hypothetical protein